MSWDIFISYAHSSRSVAMDIVKGLRTEGLAIWFDVDLIPAGIIIHQAINDGIQSSRMAVAIASSAYLSGDWPRRELGGFIAQKKPIVVVLQGVSSAFVERTSPLLAGVKHISNQDISAVVKEIAYAFRSYGFRATHANHKAMVVGAREGGKHVLKQLLAWGSVPVAGIYDKHGEAPGLHVVEANGVNVFAGRSTKLGEMLQLCGQEGFRGYYFFVFVPSRDKPFREFIRETVEQVRSKEITNFKLLWMDDDFGDWASAEALHALMR